MDSYLAEIKFFVPETGKIEKEEKYITSCSSATYFRNMIYKEYSVRKGRKNIISISVSLL